MSLTSFGEAQPSLAWDFNGTTTPYIGSATGTTTGTVSYSTGKYIQAVNIVNTPTGTPNTGTNYITWTNYGTFNPSVGVTVCFWINVNALPASGQQSFPLWMRGSVVNSAVYISLTPTNWGAVYTDGTNYYGHGSSAPLSTGVWYHLTVVVGAGTVVGYQNGVQIASPVAFSNPLDVSGFLYLGGNGNYGPASAIYDDLRIYNTALTAAQVQSIYNTQGMPSRGVAAPTPVQPGYIYAPLYNSSIIGTSSPWIVNSQNPDPTTSGITGTDNWNTDPNRTNLWSLAPFKYFIFLSRNAYPLNNIPVEGLRYPVLISVTGTYQLSLLVCTGGGNSDSLFWNFDNDTPVNQGGFSVPESFSTWYSFAGVTLTAGSHTLSLQMREPVGIGAIKLSSTIYPGTYYNVTPISMTGAPLFNQLSQSAASSAVGAFSLRAVNGVTAKAVAVQAHPVVQWPPIAMTSNNFTATGTYNGITNGVYTATSTGTIAGGTEFKLFDGDINTWYASPLTYNISSGVYNGSNNTTISSVSVSGEWVQINLPTKIILRRYDLVGRQDNSLWQQRVPTTFWIAGSNDNGSTWSNVHQQSGLTPPQSGITINVPTTSNSISYSSYRLVVNVIGYSSGQRDTLNFSSWNLYGDSPSYAPNPAQDFYADERGNLLTAPVVGTSLQNWLGGATGYVTKWYDQSGKGNDAIQNTAAAQPIIQRATKGPGYMCLYSGTQGLTFGAYNLLNNTNYTTCGVVRRTAVPAVTNYYLSGNGGVNDTDRKFHSGYRTSTLLTLAHYSDDTDLAVPSFLTSSTEPTAYNYMMVGTGRSGRLYSYSSGTLYSTTRTYVGYLNQAEGSSFSIGGGFGSFTGEIYELLVFTQSLYDLDGTTSINQIYQNQLSYTGS